MNALHSGDIVVATVDGAGWLAVGPGRQPYEEGEEFLVTSTRAADTVNVRPAPPGSGPVFKIPRSDIRKVTRMIGEAPPGGIPAKHPGIAWLFEDARRMADRLGLCDDYDRLCDALGVPGRMRSFTISLLSADGIQITAKVNAHSRALAEQKLRDQLGSTNPAAPLVLEAHRSAVEP